MKDESAYLLPAQENAAGRHAAPAPQDPPVADLPLFRPGTLVGYKGQTCTVGHVVISRCDLQVYLQELGHAVTADKLQLAPTRILLQRH